MVIIGLKKVDCLGKEEETNMKNTLNERKTNLEWRRKGHWMGKKRIWNEGEMNIEWKRTNKEWRRNWHWIKEKRIMNLGEMNIELKRKE